MIVYTDGSFLSEQNIGGYCSILVLKGRYISIAGGIENADSSTNCECAAFHQLRMYLKQEEINGIDIFITTDSSNATNCFYDMKIDRFENKREMSDDSINIIKSLVNDKDNVYHMQWIPSHKNSNYNDLADKIAREQAFMLSKKLKKL